MLILLLLLFVLKFHGRISPESIGLLRVLLTVSWTPYTYSWCSTYHIKLQLPSVLPIDFKLLESYFMLFTLCV